MNVRLTDSQYTQYVKYAPWIDIILAVPAMIRESIRHPCEHPFSRPHAENICVFPREIVTYIATIYFELIRPKIGCGYDFMIMFDNDTLVTWQCHNHSALYVGMYIETGPEPWPERKQVNDYMQHMDGSCAQHTADNDARPYYKWPGIEQPDAATDADADVVTDAANNTTTGPRVTARCLRLPLVRETSTQTPQVTQSRVFLQYPFLSQSFETVALIGRGINSVTNPTFSKHLTRIVCGDDFAIGVSSTGKFCWGNNEYGQLGLGDAITPANPIYVHVSGSIIDIACGSTHTLMIVYAYTHGTHSYERTAYTTHACEHTREYALYAHGCNEDGQLGVKLRTNALTPQRVNIANPSAVVCGIHYSLVLAGGCVYRLGDRGDTTNDAPVKLQFTDIVRVSTCCSAYRLWRRGETNPMVITDSGNGQWMDGDACRQDAHISISNFTVAGVDVSHTSCGVIEIINRGSIATLPGIILAIDGSDGYAIVTTTRGVFARTLDVEVFQLLCVL